MKTILVCVLSVVFLFGSAFNSALLRVETNDFLFFYPQSFVLIPGATEKEVIYLYGDEHGNSINVSYFDYLTGRDLNESLCTELTQAFNNSELRTQINASIAMAKEFSYKDGLKSCYYNYGFQRPNGASSVEYKVYQGTGSRSYAITIVYARDSLQQELLRKALHSFKVK
jgi:hypothetical protein